MKTLISDDLGWKILDVRAAFEVDQGKVVGSVTIPLINVKKRWESEGLQLDQDININFMAEVQKKFPDKLQGVVVLCSDGLNRSIQVHWTRVFKTGSIYTSLMQPEAHGVRY